MNRFIRHLSLTILAGLLGVGCADASQDDEVLTNDESVSAVSDESGGASTPRGSDGDVFLFAIRPGATGAAPCLGCGPIPDPWSSGPIPDPWSSGPIPDPWSDENSGNGSTEKNPSKTSGGDGSSGTPRKP